MAIAGSSATGSSTTHAASGADGSIGEPAGKHAGWMAARGRTGEADVFDEYTGERSGGAQCATAAEQQTAGGCDASEWRDV